MPLILKALVIVLAGSFFTSAGAEIMDRRPLKIEKLYPDTARAKEEILKIVPLGSKLDLLDHLMDESKMKVGDRKPIDQISPRSMGSYKIQSQEAAFLSIYWKDWSEYLKGKDSVWAKIMAESDANGNLVYVHVFFGEQKLELAP